MPRVTVKTFIKTNKVVLNYTIEYFNIPFKASLEYIRPVNKYDKIRLISVNKQEKELMKTYPSIKHLIAYYNK